MNAIDILIKYWGHTQFQLKQEEIINEVMNNNDTLALLPTGGGKSICFQVPALMQEGICLVISPLISLMDDQVRHLQSKGIKSIYISSNMHYANIDTALTNCLYGGIKFLYLSPEKLQNDLVKTRIKELQINLIAVDEAHCISEWGHNFRPSYRYISEIRSIIPKAPILALTASVTNEVIKDIQKNLLFKQENVIRSSFRRKNISYVVDNVNNKTGRLLKLLNKIKSSVIIYVRTRKASIELTSFLIKNNLTAEYYHAGLSIEKRTNTQKKWTKNEIRIIVATSAFGMGINKLDVKLVVHMYLPSSLEQYFQESGRVGRNGKTAYAFLLANSNDIKEQKEVLNLKYPSIKEILQIYQNIANYLQLGIGDFPIDPIPFDIKLFSERYKISLLKTYHILKYLEKEGLLKFTSGMYSPSKIRFIISNSELYRFQISNKSYDPFIKLLLRTYNNLFDNLVIIDEDKLANSLDSTKENISKILYKLEQLEVLDYQKKNKLEKIKFLQARIDLNVSHFNEKKWIERRSTDDEKLNKIIEYIKQKQSCRSQELLNYFGEKQLEACDVCDVCIIKKRKSITKQKLIDITNRIKNILSHNEMNLLEISNALSDMTKEEVINILNLLFENDKIIKYGNKYQWKE